MGMLIGTACPLALGRQGRGRVELSSSLDVEIGSLDREVNYPSMNIETRFKADLSAVFAFLTSFHCSACSSPHTPGSPFSFFLLDGSKFSRGLQKSERSRPSWVLLSSTPLLEVSFLGPHRKVF